MSIRGLAERARERARYVGLQRRQRANGGEHLVGVVDAEIVAPAGTRLVLRRDGEGFVVQFVWPTEPWEPSPKERAALALANAPRGALRVDQRDGEGDAP